MLGEKKFTVFAVFFPLAQLTVKNKMNDKIGKGNVQYSKHPDRAPSDLHILRCYSSNFNPEQQSPHCNTKSLSALPSFRTK